MINETLFKKMMYAAEKFAEEVERWSNFGIEIYELPVGSIPWDMFNAWSESHFDSEGQDWIDWYLWERKSLATREILPCYDKDGNKFFVNNLSELWSLVVHHRLKPCLDEPCTYFKACKK